MKETKFSSRKEYWQAMVAEQKRSGLSQKVRPFAIGRNRWLFSDTVEGAQASAILYSLVETVKANGIGSYWYLRKVFENIPKAQTVDDFERLLPWNLKKENLQPLRRDTMAVEH